MKRVDIQWLLLSAALAVGEAAAACVPRAAECWPLLAFGAIVVALIGFGFRWKIWRYLAFACLGAMIFFHATVERERVYRESPWLRNVERRQVPAHYSNALKRDMSARVGLGLEHEPEVQSLHRAILLGEKSRVPADLKRIFVNSGTIHVFAISGLHVMIVAKLLMFIAAFFFLVPSRSQGVITLPILWAYVWLIGMPPSALRAALMASFYFAAPIFWRQPNGLVAWSLAFILIHLFDPMSIESLGSIFSFTVMLALVFAVRVTRRINGKFTKGLFITFSAWAAGVPIAAVAFGRVTPGGLISNLFVIGAAFYTVVAGFLGLVFSYICEPLAIHFNNFSALATEFMIAVARLISEIPGANLEVPRWGFTLCALWYTAMALFFWLVNHVAERRGTII